MNASRSSILATFDLPDRPQVDDGGDEDNEEEIGNESPNKTRANKRGRGKKRMSWSDLLKRTFKMDVINCPGCGGRFDLVTVVFDRPTIEATLMALGIPVRAPPIAPARQCGLFGSDCADPIPTFPTDTANDWEIN